MFVTPASRHYTFAAMKAKVGGRTGSRRLVAGRASAVGVLAVAVGSVLGCGGRSGLLSLPTDSDSGGALAAATGNGTAVGAPIGGVRGGRRDPSMPPSQLPNWQRVPGAGPNRRWGSGMAYDQARQVLSLFGGWSDLVANEAGTWPLNDTWEWDGHSWSLMANARIDGVLQPGEAPVAWIYFGMTYDPRRRRVITHGGYTNGLADNCGAVDTLLNASRATWQWDGTRWKPLTCDGPEAINIELVYDTARDRVVMVGGVPDPPAYRMGSKYGTWELAGDNWLRVGDAPSLLADDPALTSPGYAMAFDGVRRVTVLQVNGNTWEWDGNSWELKSTEGPREERVGQIGVRFGNEMAYDAQRARSVLLAYDSTWEWDGKRWEERSLAPTPPRTSTHPVYDEAQGYVMLFGGDTGNYGHGPLGDTWVYRP